MGWPVATDQMHTHNPQRLSSMTLWLVCCLARVLKELLTLMVSETNRLIGGGGNLAKRAPADLGTCHHQALLIGKRAHAICKHVIRKLWLRGR